MNPSNADRPGRGWRGAIFTRYNGGMATASDSPIADSTDGGAVTYDVRTATDVGPLPPPDVLREYERLVPGSAQRLISAAESAAKFRVEQERVVAEMDAHLVVLRYRYMFAALLVMLAAAAAMAVILVRGARPGTVGPAGLLLAVLVPRLTASTFFATLGRRGGR